MGLNTLSPPRVPAGSFPPGEAEAIRHALLSWFRRRARDLPWRRTRNPYRVWLSEVMLQQTRVDTVVPYYRRFVRAFPSVQALAAAPLSRVLKLWEGLGYYARARHLHAAAQRIMREHGGRLPSSAREWAELPGVGRYTAAAIASITQGEPLAALDGNARRVLSRLVGLETALDESRTVEQLWSLAERLLDRARPGDFNQALMELGATVCRPRNPDCGVCPLVRWCRAYATGRQRELPVRARRRAPGRIEAVAAAIFRGQRCLFVRRPARGLLGGLWELPGGVVPRGRNATEMLVRHLRELLGVEVRVGRLLARVRHEFTHRSLRLRVYECALIRGRPRPRHHSKARWLPPERSAELPLARLDQKVLAELSRSRAGGAGRDGPIPRSVARK
jgi:A/G-specific adenine glycosylase